MKEIIGLGRSLWDFSIKGEVVIIDDDSFPPVDECKGKILVTHIPSPDIVLYMKEAIAIIAETGGVLCHAAVLALELGCPIIVAAEGVKGKTSNDKIVTIESLNGEGKIYAERIV